MRLIRQICAKASGSGHGSVTAVYAGSLYRAGHIAPDARISYYSRKRGIKNEY